MLRERLFAWIATTALARPRLTLALALTSATLAATQISKLEILTSRQGLNPPGDPEQVRFEAFLQDFGNPQNLVVVLEGPATATQQAAELVHGRLAQMPDLVRGVFYRFDTSFFRDHGFLYLPRDTLENFRNAVATHAETLREDAKNPSLEKILHGLTEAASGGTANIEDAPQLLRVARVFLDTFAAALAGEPPQRLRLFEDAFAATQIEARHQETARTGYLMSHHGDMLFMFVQPARASDRTEDFVQLTQGVRRAVNSINPQSLGVSFGLTGTPAVVTDEMTALTFDLTWTTVLSSGLIFILLLGTFRSWRRAAYIFVPLIVGVAVNFCLTAWIIGHLNLLSSAFVGIVFGLGVDYAIYIIRRYDELRPSIPSQRDALIEAMRRNGPGVISGAFTTIIAFFIIGLSPLPSLAELGIIAGFGVTWVLIATLWLIPPLVLLFDGGAISADFVRPNWQSIVVARHPGMAVTVAAALCILGAVFARDIPFSYDLLAMLPKGSESVAYQAKMIRSSDFTMEFAAAMARDMDEVYAITEKMRAAPGVARVASLADVLPADQDRRAEAARSLAAELEQFSLPETLPPPDATVLAQAMEKLTAAMEDAQERAFSAGHGQTATALDGVIQAARRAIPHLSDPRAQARAAEFQTQLFDYFRIHLAAFKRWRSAHPIAPSALTDDIRRRFMGQSGSYAVYAFPKGSMFDKPFLESFVAEMRAISPTATGFPVTFNKFGEQIWLTFRNSFFAAAMVVFLVMVADLRSLHLAAMGALPLLCAFLWSTLTLKVFGGHYNFANIMAAPMLLGIGEDYGVHIIHRLRGHGGETPAMATQTTGRAITLAAATTIAGFGSLGLARHEGASSMGILLACGVFFAFVAATVVVPALWALTRFNHKRSAE